MVKMAELHAEGITSLHDYQLGKEHKLLEITALIRKVIENPDLAGIPSRIAMQVLLATLADDTNE